MADNSSYRRIINNLINKKNQIGINKKTIIKDNWEDLKLLGKK